MLLKGELSRPSWICGKFSCLNELPSHRVRDLELEENLYQNVVAKYTNVMIASVLSSSHVLR